jgi:hypothetical protein
VSEVGMQSKYEKMRTATLNYLKGREDYETIGTLHNCEDVHSGLRKDGITPEFYHQLCMLNYARNLKLSDAVSLSKLFKVILTHDVYEDYSQVLSETGLEITLSKTGKTTEFYYI